MANKKAEGLNIGVGAACDEEQARQAAVAGEEGRQAEGTIVRGDAGAVGCPTTNIFQKHQLPDASSGLEISRGSLT